MHTIKWSISEVERFGWLGEVLVCGSLARYIMHKKRPLGVTLGLSAKDQYGHDEQGRKTG